MNMMKICHKGSALGEKAIAAMEACTAKVQAREKMANVALECDSKYSDEEMQKLEELADAIAHTECFQYIFKKSCGTYAIKSLTKATNEKKEEKAMCLSDEATGKMMEICHGNSALGEKANAAEEVCSAKAEARAKAGKGKGKGREKERNPTSA